MNIWLVMSGEPLALYGERAHRIGMLSEILDKKENQVTWWTTTFDHQKKSYFFDDNKTVNVSSNLSMKFLHSKKRYSKNISLSRVINHIQVSKEFSNQARSEEKPDIILCCFPTIDLAFEATKYGKEMSVPVIIDVRDLWPDIFLDAIPTYLHPLGKFALKSLYKKTEYIFENCTAITAVSKKYLDWTKKYSGKVIDDKDAVFPLAYKCSEEVNVNNYSELRSYFENLGVDSDKIIIWFVGTFGKTYDLSPVIEAARVIDDSRIQFVFTGEGEQGNLWRRMASDLDNVIFTGWADKKGIAYLSSVASIGLMAYRKGAPQGLPNKVFEYLAAGLPILSSLETETKDLLELHEVGFTYKASDSRDFQSKLGDLVANPAKLEKLGKQARRSFVENYSADTVYEEMVNYLSNTIQEYKNRT
jgi:glycosyltransferase involved in cell wall biosynthesis